LPVVSFDCPCGPSDIVTPHEDGLLVENCNVEQLGIAISRMIEDPDMRQNYGRKARSNSMRFSQDSVMSLWIRLFDKVCNRHDSV